MVAEAHALLRNLAQASQAPYLEAAAVRQHGAVPPREGVQATEVADGFITRAQAEVVGVAEDDVGAERLQIFRVQGFNRALCAYGHEDGGGHITMGEVQGAESRPGGVGAV